MDRPHGEYNIQVEENIIILTLKGQFNEHSIIEYHKDIRGIVESIGAKGFCLLIDGLLFSGATPEALKESNKFNQFLNSENLLGKAILCQSKLFVSLSRANESEMSVQNIKEFTQFSNAISWLKSLSK